MSLVERLPALKSGHRYRNVAVSVGYVVLFLLVLALLPVFAAWAVASNYRESAAHLSGLPGVDADGGLQAGLLAGAYVFVVWGVALSVGGLAAGYDRAGAGGADSPADGESSLADDEQVLLFQTVVQQRDVDLRSIELSDDVLVVEYSITGATEEDVTEDVAILTGSYIDRVDHGLETERMDVTVVDPDDGTERANWRVEADWAEAYLAGEQTEEAVLERVYETFELTTT